MPRRRLAAAIGSAVAALLLAACAASPAAERPSRTVHADGDGPLSASIGSGGNALLAPAARHWTGTFGAFVLCAKEPGTHIELQRVRWRASVSPEKVVPMVRTVSPSALRPLTAAQRARYLPSYGALGSPPAFTEPYIDAVVPGSYSTRVRGRRVGQSCGQTATAQRQLGEGEVPSQPTHELVFVVGVGPRGGQIDQVDVDYLADGRPMTLRLHWMLVSCGTGVTEPGACDDPGAH